MERALDGTTILITGATGFFGKIYVLIRPQAGVASSVRLQTEIIDSPIFDRLRRERSHDFVQLVSDKLHAVDGDTTCQGLALTAEDAAQLETTVNIMIHSAVTVDFSAGLRDGVKMNCIGAMHALKFAKRCSQLGCYVHVSTAYVNSNCRNRYVQEKLYPLGFDVDAKLHEIMHASPIELEGLAQHVRRLGYPNTYTFTKFMAEHLIAAHASKAGMPLVLFRPTIIGAAWKEPSPGWGDQIAGIGAVMVAMSMGAVTAIPGKPSNVIDVVPVDMAVNSLLVATGFKMMEQRQQQAAEAKVLLPLIVHCGTSDPRQSPLRLRVTRDETIEYFRKHPPSLAPFPCTLNVTPSLLRFFVQWHLSYTLPSCVYAVIAARTKHPRHVKHAAGLAKVTCRARRVVDRFRPFAENQWVFLADSSHSLTAFDATSEWGHITRGIVWENYFADFCMGLQRFAVRDQLSRSKL